MPHDPTHTLTGWKEISSHLRVTVRTAQSWEKQRGLPIHRYPGDGKPRVYAYPRELEAWLRDSPSEPEDTLAPEAKRAEWPRLALVVLAIFVLGSVAWIWNAEPVEKRIPVRCALNEKVLQALDDEDHVIWQESFPDAIGDLRQRRELPVCHVLDADLDGMPEVYFQFWGENRLQQGGELIRMTDDGHVDWRRPYGKPLEVGVPDDGPLMLSILSSNGKLTYSLDVESLQTPRVTNVVAEMGFRVAHDHVADEGLVDHRLGPRMPDVYYQVLVYETAPNGNAPEMAQALGQ